MSNFKRVLAPIVVALAATQVHAQAPVSDLGEDRTLRASTNVNVEMYQQLQQLRQEVMALRGIVEEQSNQIRQLKQQSIDRYIDVDRRISALSTAAPVAAGATATAAVTAAADADVDAEPVASVGGETADPGTGNPSSDYARAYSLVSARQYREAIDAFSRYVKQYPDGEYTPNAWYWLGELYVAVDPPDLQAATQAFKQLLTEYPDNRKVPAAMYKLATVYFQLGDKQRAEEMLTHVIDRYGSTGNSAVKKSREFLRKNF